MELQLLIFLGIAGSSAAMAYKLYFNEGAEKIRLPRALSVKVPQSLSRGTQPEAAKIAPRPINAIPISGICGSCGEQSSLPFKCKFCSGLFCGEHRLPENHACDGL